MATASSAARAAARRDERHVDFDAAPIDVLERPILLPLLERQRSRPAIDVAHRLDVLAGVGEKALPLLGMISRGRALDAEQPDELLAVLLLALAAEVARSAFQIGRQVGDAGLDHRIDDALRREKGKAERSRNSRSRCRSSRSTRRLSRRDRRRREIVRRVVPIQDLAVGMPSARRLVADGVGQNDRARRSVGGIARTFPHPSGRAR